MNFDDAWEEKKKAGFTCSPNQLGNLRFGWFMAEEEYKQDALRFRALQAMDRIRAQSMFWNQLSCRERAKEIDKWIKEVGSADM